MAHKHGRWTPEEVALLGTMSDKDVAVKLGVTSANVQASRYSRGIPSFNRRGRPTQIVWTAEMDALLGTVTDLEAATRLNVSISSIKTRRKALGHPPLRKLGPAWQPEWSVLLGTMPDVELAEKLGVCVDTVRVRREGHARTRPRLNWAQHDSLLGKMPDSEAAARIGCATGTVTHRRHALAIKAYRLRGKDVSGNQARVASLSDVELLRPINELTVQYLVSNGAIRAERLRRGLHKQLAERRGAMLRRAAVLALLTAGATLEEAAAMLHPQLTRERVRQIVEEARASLLVQLDEDATRAR